MTPEEHSQNCADKFAAVETAIRELASAVQEARAPLNIPPVTFYSIKGGIWGALGSVAQAHLNITPYDARPQPQDGGGGK